MIGFFASHIICKIIKNYCLNFLSLFLLFFLLSLRNLSQQKSGLLRLFISKIHLMAKQAIASFTACQLSLNIFLQFVRCKQNFFSSVLQLHEIEQISPRFCKRSSSKRMTINNQYYVIWRYLPFALIVSNTQHVQLFMWERVQTYFCSEKKFIINYNSKNIMYQKV